MKIAFFGYGKMNRAVEQMAHQHGHTTTIIITSQSMPLQEEHFVILSNADIIIDCTHASATIDHLRISLSLKKPIVIGTTGWEDHLDEAEKLVKEHNGACFYSPNFSIGMYLFQQLVTHAASFLPAQPHYSIAGHEQHHAQKKDRPSGTAKSLTQLIRAQTSQFNGFTSERSGDSNGIHSIQLNSAADRLVLTHEAHNRDGFALGALRAAEWLLTRKGFFTMQDMMEDA
jgi:4-hydroxy-tetrahydrodipicolinate reductase